jgi:hypothetical protein
MKISYIISKVNILCILFIVSDAALTADVPRFSETYRTIEKLQTIHLPANYKIEELSLKEACSILVKESKRLDPDAVGIEVVFSGELLSAMVGGNKFEISLNLKNSTDLLGVFELVAQIHPIKYSIKDTSVFLDFAKQTVPIQRK